MSFKGLATAHQLRWPIMPCSNGCSIQIRINRDLGDYNATLGRKCVTDYNGADSDNHGDYIVLNDGDWQNPSDPTDVHIYEGAPSLLNIPELVQKYATSEGNSSFDNLMLTFRETHSVNYYYTYWNGSSEQTDFEREEFGTANFPISGDPHLPDGMSIPTTTLQVWNNLDARNDPAYWVWITFYDPNGNADIYFCGQYKASLKPQKHSLVAEPHTEFETLRGTRSFQCVAVATLLSQHSWQEVCATVKESDCQQGVFYSGYALFPSNEQFGTQYSNANGIFTAGDSGSPNDKMLASPYFFQGNTASDGPITLSPNDRITSASKIITGQYDPCPSFSGAWQRGTWGIKVQKVLDLAAQIASIESAPIVCGLDLHRQKPDNTNLCFPIGELVIDNSGVQTGYDPYISLNVYFGFHPFDGRGGVYWNYDGITPHDSCRVTSITNLSATYVPGTGIIFGVGATLTNAGANAALTIDGVTLSVNDRVLVNGQSGVNVQGDTNGIYTVTTVGDGSTPWVLTRTTDYDGSSIYFGAVYDFVIVAEGIVNAGTAWTGDFTNTGTGSESNLGFPGSGENCSIFFNSTPSSPFVWNNPAGFSRTSSIKDVIKLLANNLICDVIYPIDQTTGLPKITLLPVGTASGTLPANWVLQSSGEVPNTVGITNVQMQNTGDSMTMQSPLLPGPSTSIAVPWRLRRIGNPLPSSAFLPSVQASDLTFDGSITDLQQQAPSCFQVASFDRFGFDLNFSPLDVLRTTVNPDCWKGLTGVYYFNASNTNVAYPSLWNSLPMLQFGNLVGGGGPFKYLPTYPTPSWANSFYCLGALFSPGAAIPTIPPTSGVSPVSNDQFSSIIYPCIVNAAFKTQSGSLVQREYDGITTDPDVGVSTISGVTLGFQSTFHYGGKDRTFRAIELYRNPRFRNGNKLYARSKVTYSEVLATFPGLHSLSYGPVSNGSTSGGTGTTYGGGGGGGGSSTVSVGVAVTSVNLVGNVNNLEINFGSFWTRVQLSSTGNDNITGIAGGTTGQVITFYNGNTSAFNISFLNENTSSLATNRFHINGGSSILIPGSSRTFMFDGTISRWTPIII